MSFDKKQWRLENKEKIKEKSNQYYLYNKEKIKVYSNKYRLDNKEKINQYYLDNKEKIKQYQLDNKEKIKQYQLDNKEKTKQYYKKKYLDNKDKILEKSKQYYLDNKEKSKEKRKQYNLNNKEKINRYRKKRKETNSLFKLSCNLRTRICDAIKKKYWHKNSSTIEILGCDFETVKKHLENKFIDDMSWNNHGKWHIDHIKPLAKAENEEELYKRCHYTNLQPLWAADNLSKGAREL